MSIKSTAVSIQDMGTQRGDLLVVNAARVSMDKSHEELVLPDDEKLINYLAKHGHWTPFAHPQYYRVVMKPAEAMVHYLLETEPYQFRRRFLESHNGLMSLIEGGSLYAYLKNGLVPESMIDSLSVKSLVKHSGLPNEDFICFSEADPKLVPQDIQVKTFRSSMPLFVARQWYKHQIGFVRNERSRRYVSGGMDFFVPVSWRGKPEGSVKQGSGSEVDEDSNIEMSTKALLNTHISVNIYEGMLANNIATEQARMVLPQNMMIEFIETGSYGAYDRLIKQRLDPHAQKEIRDGAKMLQEMLYE